MRGPIASIAVLLVATSFAMPQRGAPAPGWSAGNGSTLWLAGASNTTSTQGGTSAKKPKKPPVKAPPPKTVPGAHDATKGQTGRCICSTNAQGTTTCTGGC